MEKLGKCDVKRFLFLISIINCFTFETFCVDMKYMVAYTLRDTRYCVSLLFIYLVFSNLGGFNMSTGNWSSDKDTGLDYGEKFKPVGEIFVVKKDGSKEAFNVQKVINAVAKSAYRALTKFTPEENEKICRYVISRVD